MYDYLMRDNQRSLLNEAANHHLVRQSQLARLHTNPVTKPSKLVRSRTVSYRTLAWLGRQFSTWGEALQDRYPAEQEDLRAHSRYYGRV